uniref:Uncharacterized protein n=1 Tax=Plectus sambesii TaxID=2011161 RepID=A0A914V0U9_9BILA
MATLSASNSSRSLYDSSGFFAGRNRRDPFDNTSERMLIDQAAAPFPSSINGVMHQSQSFLPPLRSTQTAGSGLPRNATAGSIPMDTSTMSAAGNHIISNKAMSSSVSTLSGGSEQNAAVLQTMSHSQQQQRQKLSKSPSAESLRSADSSNSDRGNGSGSGAPVNKGYRAEDAVRTFGSKLASYEHTEIYNYPRVYFVGSQAKKRGGMIGAANNCGYDDENGSYLLVAHDHVAYRYEVLKVIGKGSFGQ